MSGLQEKCPKKPRDELQQGEYLKVKIRQGAISMGGLMDRIMDRREEKRGYLQRTLPNKGEYLTFLSFQGWWGVKE